MVMRRANLHMGLVAVLLTAIPLFAQNEQKTSPDRLRLEEFCRRAAKISPLDAAAHFDLARWCNESGLGKQARRYLESTIAIDADHAAARKALGYARHGTGWILEAERDKNRSRQVPDDADGEETDAGGAAEEPLVIEPEEIDSTDFSPVETEEMTDADAVVDVTELDAALAAKKEWAAASEGLNACVCIAMANILP